MLENSQDFLNIIKAVSIFGLAFFACWAIFYLAMIMKQGYKIIKEMRDRLHKVDKTIKLLKEKIEHSTSYLLLIGEGVKKLVDVIEKKIKIGKKGKSKK